MGARFYDPLFSTFLSPDPLSALSGGSPRMNRYGGGSFDRALFSGLQYARSEASYDTQRASRAAAKTPTADVAREGYRTAWEAARGALERYNPQSILSKAPNNQLSTGTEYGGLIYERGGRYYYTSAARGEREGAVDPWQQLGEVPADARNRIVGDHHTHGGPNPIFDGEDFSGFHYEIGSGSQSMLDGSDIHEAFSDLTKYRANMLEPTRFTSYLGTPQGRFGIYNPSLGIVFHFSPNARLLPAGWSVSASAYSWH